MADASIKEGSTTSIVSTRSWLDAYDNADDMGKVPARVSYALHNKGFRVNGDGIVSWHEGSITHPRRWPLFRKVFDTAIVCFLEFFTTLISNTGSSIAPHVANDLAISQQSALLYLTTTYLVGQAIGGLIFPPLAESFGGRTIYLSSTLGFAGFCAWIAAEPILPVLIAGRFISGFLSSIPSTVAAGTIENLWDIRSRTIVIRLWINSSVLGLCLGPAVGTYIATSTLEWRAVFVIAAAVTGLVAFLCAFMQESRPSRVMQKHVSAVSKEHSYDGLSLDDKHALPTVWEFITSSLLLPLRLFFTEPIVTLASIMAATVYGIMYLFSESFGMVYGDSFGFTPEQSALVILAIAVGIVPTTLPMLYDVRVAGRRQREGRDLQPEDKLFGFYLAAPSLAISLWWFALTVPPLATGISPWVSIVALTPIGFSTSEFDTVLSGYLTDSYASYAGSANAPMSFLRAMTSGLLPLAGRSMFTSLNPNNALIMLAAIATAYCGVAVLLYLYGKRLRQRSPLADRTWGGGSDSESLHILTRHEGT